MSHPVSSKNNNDEPLYFHWMFIIIIIIIIGIKALSKAITFGIIYLTTNTLNNNIPKVMIL